MTANPDLFETAWRLLDESVLMYNGRPVGTIAARDASMDALNYDQCFIRDFVPSALAYLIAGRPEIVRNFFEVTVGMRAECGEMAAIFPTEGLVPASFKVMPGGSDGGERLIADFGNHAIGRVAPVDSGLWWIILLRAYQNATGDTELAQRPEFQRQIDRILGICFADRFDIFPTMLVPDGAFMIDRRMGVYGHPLEIQALYYGAIRAAQELMEEQYCERVSAEMIERRKGILREHIREYYWLDLYHLNTIYRFQGEQFGEDVMNRFNINADSIPRWLTELLPDEGGYLAGNLGPQRMDFRFYALGNMVASLTSLASPVQRRALLHFIDERWDRIVGCTPMKILYPALEDLEWRQFTGSDPKNKAWSYHNGGSWPTLLWPFVAACMRTGREDMARRAIGLARAKLVRDEWPEYYDGSNGRLIGRYARKYQTWTIAGLIVAEQFLEDPRRTDLIAFEDDCAPEKRGCDGPFVSERAIPREAEESKPSV